MLNCQKKALDWGLFQSCDKPKEIEVYTEIII